MYRILGKHLVLEGPQFPRIFPQAKSSIVQGKVFTAVPYETDVCKFLETRGYKIPPPPFDKYRILNRHLVLEGGNFPSLFPQAKTSVVQGRCFTALPHELEICQYLNNLGYTVPSPITTQYPFRSKYPSPMPHQVETASFLTLNRRAFNLSGMGAAKTLSALWAADFLILTGAIRRVLVVSPLSTLQVVWGKEIFTNFPHLSYAILHGSRDTRRELCEQKHDVYVVNHHGVELVKEYLPEDIDLVIVDEVAIYRTHTTNLWKALKSYIKPNHWVWGMTGTPTPNSPTDAYGQMKLIVPERCPNMSFTRCKYEMMLKLSMFKWIPRKGAEQKAYEMLQPAIRYDISQCINMPETIYHDRECELSKEQKHHYKEMERECFTEINGVHVTAVNGAVLLGKLIQASCGVVYGPKGEIAKLDFGPRLSVLKECIESCNEKVIVFVPLTGMLKALYDKLNKKWKCGVIDGSVSSGKRNQIFNEFQDGSEMKVLLANPSAMSHGINLTCATTTVWYCPIHSNEVYQQANARMRRPGQKKTMNIVHMYGTKVEARIYKRLQEKGSLQDLVLDLVRESM